MRRPYGRLFFVKKLAIDLLVPKKMTTFAPL